MLTTTADEVRPAGARLEGWVLAAATLAVSWPCSRSTCGCTAAKTSAPELYDWQISAFDGLTGADQAIYNSLYTVKDEIPVIYDDINRFNEPGVKFRWPNLQDFEDCAAAAVLQATRAGSRTAR